MQGFAEELHRQGYRPDGARGQLRLMSRLSRWHEDQGLGAADHRHPSSGRRVAGLMAYLREVGATPPPPPVPAPEGAVEELLDRYRTYAVRERGIEEKTARREVDHLRPLLEGLASREGEIDRSLVDAVPAIGGWRGQSLPKGLAPAELEGIGAKIWIDLSHGRPADDPGGRRHRRPLQSAVADHRPGSWEGDLPVEEYVFWDTALQAHQIGPG